MKLTFLLFTQYSLEDARFHTSSLFTAAHYLHKINYRYFDSL